MVVFDVQQLYLRQRINDGLNDLMQQYRRVVDAAAGNDSDVESFFTVIDNHQPETLSKEEMLCRY